MTEYYIVNDEDKTYCTLGTYLKSTGFLGYGSEDTQGHRSIINFVHSSQSECLKICSSSLIPENYKRVSI